MAFVSRIGNVLKQTVSKNANANVKLCASNSMLYQAVRSMSSKLFVGGLSYSTDDQSLQQAFAQHGEVVEARIIMDRDNGRSRGFGFVTFASEEDAQRAMQALDGQELHGRNVRVNIATEKPRPPRYESGGFYNSGGGSGGDGGYNSGGGYGGGGGGGSYGGGYGGNSSGSYGGGGAVGGGWGNSGNNNYGGGVGGNFGGATNPGGFAAAPGYGSTNLGVDGPDAVGDFKDDFGGATNPGAVGDFKDDFGDEPSDFANRG